MASMIVVGTAVTTFPVTILLAAAVVVVLLGLTSSSPEQHLMRERRRHAERTARTLRRMSEIRRQTVERMDRASERGR
jgi:pantothenate synthetase